ncbi:MAG: 6-phospho-3-hexuloisomerase [Mycobacterium sp.]
MSTTTHLKTILGELTSNQRWIDDAQLDELADAILAANHVFLSGAGRSGVAIRGFANRLVHLGFSASMVGDVTSPHTSKGDLLIVGSGSGRTESLVALGKTAQASGVSVALVTMDADSILGRMADVVVVLPGASPKVRGEVRQVASVQPMGSAFEQITALTFDAVVLELMERTGQTSDDMFARHADLE